MVLEIEAINPVRSSWLPGNLGILARWEVTCGFCRARLARPRGAHVRYPPELGRMPGVRNAQPSAASSVHQDPRLKPPTAQASDPLHDAQTQAKEIPLDALFHKVVMIRDRLRVLEQKINAHEKLSDAEKVDIQQYVTRCYGSLTTFNLLFRDEKDRFVGEKTA